MTDAADLSEEDKPIWNEPFDPPPWNAVPAAEHDDTLGEDDETYIVVCDGFDDETPIVCVGAKDWPLGREQALILAASLEMLPVLREIQKFQTCGPGMDARINAAIAKAEGKDQ